jgi:Fe2+ or Zn2+ uptake regulation protein
MKDFTAQLKKHRMKATRQRLAVHEAMCALGHASADQVAEWLSRDPETRISVASVYNTLIQLADARIYARRLSANNKMYFDVNTDCHIHLYDRENHRWRDIADEELSDLVATHLKRRRFRGYTVEDIDIQLVARPTKKNK